MSIHKMIQQKTMMNPMAMRAAIGARIGW